MSRKPTPVDLLDEVLGSDEFSRENLRGAVVWLPISKIYDNPFQTRQSYDEEHINKLAENIHALADELPDTLGLQQPPVARLIEFGDDGDARVVERGAYSAPATLRKRARSERHAVELHFGHNRLRAWRELRNRDERYAEFPVFLAYADDPAMWRHAVTENAHRKDITPIEEAISIRHAMNRFRMTQEQAGAPFGYAKSTVSNKLRLLDLPDEYQAMLVAGTITERHGRELLRLAQAPILLPRVGTADALAAMSVRQLEEQVNLVIAECEPIAPQPRTGYMRGHRSNRYAYNVVVDPPIWPLEWEPSQQVPGIVGACQGCKFYVHFGGDAGARCARPQLSDSCYELKTKRWNYEQIQAQQAAIEAQRTASRVVYAAPEPAPLNTTGKPLAEFTDDDWKQAEATAEANDAARAAAKPSATVRYDVPISDVPQGEVAWFRTNDYDAPKSLLDKGLCDAERCPCFVLAYNPRAESEHVRPDPEHAPNMCYGCTSKQRLVNRRKEMEVGDVSEHRRRVKAEQEESERLLAEAYAGLPDGALWSNRLFLASIAMSRFTVTDNYQANNWDVATLTEKLYWGVAARACKTWSTSKEIWSLERVQSWLRSMFGGTVAPEMIGEDEDSEEDDSEEEAQLELTHAGSVTQWTDADEDSFQCLMMEWDGSNYTTLLNLVASIVDGDNVDCSVTRNVIERLAHDCSIETVRREFLKLAHSMPEAA